MKVEYNNLYTHFVFTTLHRLPLIVDQHRERIEKYITGIVKNNESHLYAIYANPEHVHFLISRAPNVSEETIATIVANSSERFINENKFCQGKFKWPRVLGVPLFRYQKGMSKKYATTSTTSQNIIARLVTWKNMIHLLSSIRRL
ncbi:MAG: transposase [Bacteroidota bacterium]|nr:transposase [Bacteroidota bacterium]